MFIYTFSKNRNGANVPTRAEDTLYLIFREFLKVNGGDDGVTEPWQNNASTRDPPLLEPPYYFSEED